MLNLRQSQSLQQKLSPQQIQYIKLLQLPTLALEQRIKAELESNPLLEEGEEEYEDDSPEADIAEAEAAQDEPDERNDDEFDWDEFLNAPDDLYGYKAQVDRSAEEEDRETPMAATSLTRRRPLRPGRAAQPRRDADARCRADHRLD